MNMSKLNVFTRMNMKSKNQVNKKVNIQVPENMMEHIIMYTRLLEIEKEKKEEEEEKEKKKEKKKEKAEEEEEEEESKQCEITGIYNHRITSDGKWQFQVGWKGFNTRDWVDDEDCNCENSISLYLRDKGISTAYLFCRVSTPGQASSVSISLDAQEAELRAAVADMKEYNRVRVYSISQSAYRDIPRVLQRIGEACLPQDAIFFWRVDRLSRNIVKYLSWLEDLNNRNVMLYSHQEKLSYSDKKLSFLQAVLDAQKDSALIGERIKLAYRRKRVRGDERIGRLPYGKKYHRVLDEYGNTSRMIVVNNPDEQAIIDRIKSSSKNASLLAKEFNNIGIHNKNKKWTSGMIRRIRYKL